MTKIKKIQTCHPGLVLGSKQSFANQILKQICNDKRTAFTLAEVLITISIIGIVAVTVMPTLIQKCQEKFWTISAMLFQRKLEESLKIMNTQDKIGQLGTTENFLNHFRQYIKIIRTCKENELTNCFTNEFLSNVKDYDNRAITTKITKSASALANSLKAKWQNDVFGVDFVNGVSAIVIYNKNCQGNQFSNTFEGTSCLSGYIDVNGNAKPNELGKDIFAYGSAAASGMPSMKFAGKTWSSPFKPESLSLDECEKLADEGYGVTKEWCNSINEKASTVGRNYFAGAIKGCGGISNIPKQQDLVELAKTLYPWNTMWNWEQATNKTGSSSANRNVEFYAFCPESSPCRYEDKVSEFIVAGGHSSFAIISFWDVSSYDSYPLNAQLFYRNLTSNAAWTTYYYNFDSITLGICEVK